MSDNHDVDYLRAKTGLKSWLMTIDHKRLGLMYLVSVLFFFLVGGIFALLVRTELLTHTETIMSAQEYNQAFTMHGVIMVFMVIIPSVPAALGNFVLPLQLGAKDVAFPKLNLLSYYIYVTGSLFAVYSMVSGAVDTGWTFYTPYSSQSSQAVVSMTLAAFILGFSSILTGMNFVTTVHKMRARDVVQHAFVVRSVTPGTYLIHRRQSGHHATDHR